MKPFLRNLQSYTSRIIVVTRIKLDNSLPLAQKNNNLKYKKRQYFRYVKCTCVRHNYRVISTEQLSFKNIFREQQIYSPLP